MKSCRLLSQHKLLPQYSNIFYLLILDNKSVIKEGGKMMQLAGKLSSILAFLESVSGIKL